MKTLYTDMNIKFNIDNANFSVLNIIYENFSRIIPKHSHGSKNYEIHYIPNGHGTVILDGKAYEVTPNTLYITGPHIEHEQIPDITDPMSEYCIYLRMEKNEKSDTSTDDNFLSVFENTKLWFGQDTQDMYTCIQMIFHELEHQYSGYMVQIEALLKQCIIKLIRNYEIKKASHKKFEQANLSDSKYIVAEECFLYDYKYITLEMLSTKLGLSPRQTDRFLKSCYGKTFAQKKAEAKMSVAAVLLSDKRRTITEISNELGYSSSEHFATAFKRYYGMTAREYRKRYILSKRE